MVISRTFAPCSAPVSGAGIGSPCRRHAEASTRATPSINASTYRDRDAFAMRQTLLIGPVAPADPGSPAHARYRSHTDHAAPPAQNAAGTERPPPAPGWLRGSSRD